MSKKKNIRYIVVTLEIIDGEITYVNNVLSEVTSVEGLMKCAERTARTYYGKGRKIRGEDFYETSGGELLIKIMRTLKVENDDVTILKKYFNCV